MRLTEDRRRTAQLRTGEATSLGARPRAKAHRGRVVGPGSTLRLVFMRLGRGRALLALLTLGMLVGVVVACTVPLYNALVGNVQLQHTLTASTPAEHNLDAFAQYDYLFRDQAGLDAAVRRFAEQDVGSFTSPMPLHYADSQPLLVQRIGKRTFDIAGGGVQAQVRAMDYALAAPHMHFNAGHAPLATSGGAKPEAAIPAQLAQVYGTKVGDSLTLVAFGNHDAPLTVHIVGIWEPRDGNDPFWNGLSFFSPPDDKHPLVSTVELTYNDFFRSVSGGLTPEITEHWIYYTQLQQVSTQNIEAVANGLGNFHTHIRQNLPVDTHLITNSDLATQLPTMLQSVGRQTALLALPLYFIAAPTIGLALLFIAAVAAMLIEAQAEELATLKSRGLSAPQLLGAFALQGVLPGVLALLAGPPLAAFAAIALVRNVVPLESLAQSGATPAYLAGAARPGDALLAAAVAPLLGLVVLTAAAFRAARLDVLAFRREEGRPSRQPLWRRFHLDLVLALVCALGYLELAQFGNTSTRLILGNLANSPLLLAAPSLLLLAGALLLLRLLPAAARLGASMAARTRGLTAQLAFTSIARHPARHGRVVLLLALAVGLGLFAVTYDSALAVNAQDRAAYETGADLRLRLLFELGDAEQRRYEADLAKLPGITDQAPVYRDQAITSPADSSGDQALDLLGVEPASFGRVAASSWRNDYGDASLSDLMGRLADHAGPDKPVIISDTLATALHVRVGDRITIRLRGADFTRTPFKVAAIVGAFPTLYPAERPLGFAVANLADVSAVINQGQSGAVGGPNEYWLTTSQDLRTQATLLNTLKAQQSSLTITSLISRSDELQKIQTAPLNAGMRGLLLAGATVAAILAILGILVQSVLAAHQRTAQFAVLRTLGMARSQLTGLLLSEQLAIYLLGTLGGTVLGLLLATATLPFLQFGDTTLDPTTLGIPPYRLALDPRHALAFYAALLAAVALSLVIAARYANRLGLGRALRVGED
jgi:putative ABC transport system permease protein